jgi:hypothetical protein
MWTVVKRVKQDKTKKILDDKKDELESLQRISGKLQPSSLLWPAELHFGQSSKVCSAIIGTVQRLYSGGSYHVSVFKPELFKEYYYIICFGVINSTFFFMVVLSLHKTGLTENNFSCSK